MFPVNINDLKMQRAQLKAKAETLVNAAMLAGRDLTDAEQKEYEAHTAGLKTIQAQIDRHASLATFNAEPTASERPIIHIPDAAALAEKHEFDPEAGEAAASMP